MRTLRSVEIARQLQSNREVPGVVLDRAALIARVRQHVARELPTDAIRNEGLTLQLFGFVPTDLDYEAAEYQLLQDQLAGYYEPGDGTMYMAADLGEDEAETTLAHELVHALQDQRWDLESRSRYRPGEGDRSEAVSALAEGDATSAMFDVMIGRSAAGAGKTALDLPDKVFESQIRQGISEGPGSKAPHVMRSSLAAPYIYGTIFVHALRRRGGWAAVDGAWNDAPTTSDQILHIDKWLAHEPPLPVAAPPFATLGEGWAAVDEDSEGELGARLAFEGMGRRCRGHGAQRRLGRRPRSVARQRRPVGIRVALAVRPRHREREGRRQYLRGGLRGARSNPRDAAGRRPRDREGLRLLGASG